MILTLLSCKGKNRQQHMQHNFATHHAELKKMIHIWLPLSYQCISWYVHSANHFQLLHLGE